MDSCDSRDSCDSSDGSDSSNGINRSDSSDSSESSDNKDNIDKTNVVQFFGCCQMWQNSKSQIVTKPKNSNCDKIKNSNWGKTQKLKLWRNHPTHVMDILPKKSNIVSIIHWTYVCGKVWIIEQLRKTV